MMDLTVRVVDEAEEPDLNCYTCVAAENPDGTGEHVEFQRQLEPDDEERPYALVAHADNSCSIGGALSWGFNDRTLVVRLTDEAAARLEVDEGIRLDLRELDAADVERLEKGVARVLVDVPRDDNLAATTAA